MSSQVVVYQITARPDDFRDVNKNNQWQSLFSWRILVSNNKLITAGTMFCPPETLRNASLLSDM